MNVGFDVLGLAVKPVDGTLLGDIVTVDVRRVKIALSRYWRICQ